MPGTTSNPSSSGATTSVAPGATATSAPSGPGSTAGPTTWARLTLADAPAVADLQPTKSGRGGVAVDTAFRLTSLDGRAPAAVAARLVSDPPLTFSVSSIDGASAVLRPTAPLRAGTLYRITLTRADGTAEGAWAAQTASPLEVIETIPGDAATGVPLDAGIEIIFNQFGVAASDLKRHFTISPAVSGHFEAAGRTIAFVPSRPLAKGRVYTVTVTHGVPLAGTGQLLAKDVVVRFETAATIRSRVTVAFVNSFLEATAREQAAMSLSMDGPEGVKTPGSIPVTVHRLAGLAAAMDAWETIEAAPEWALVNAKPAVPTAGLTRVVKASLKVQTVEDQFLWIQLPKRLATGWYLVTETWAGLPRQAVLQVTDIATFTMLSVGKSAVWVNDLATRKAAAGATVSIDGRRLGTTDGRGLLVATTPSSILKANETQANTMMVVRYGSRAAFQPISLDGSCGACDTTVAAGASWWSLFSSDRSTFRSTDTVNAWGVARNQVTGAVPSSVTATLRSAQDPDDVHTPISTTRATPDATGAFAVSVALKALPVGSYRLVLTAGTAQIGELWLGVATIVKPAYQIEMTTSRHAVLDRETLTASVHASFFDGSPVAGAELSLSPDQTDNENTNGEVLSRTDVDGDASGKVTMWAGSEGGQWRVASVGVIPTLPEEAQISASSDVAVFRSTALVDTTATVAGTRLTVSGKVSDVVFGRFETPSSEDLSMIDPRGAGRANAAVLVRIVERWTVRRQTGTSYDFVLKRATPVYAYDDHSAPVSSSTQRTGADGTFHFALTVRGGDRSYEVSATYTDEGNRTTTASATADGPQVANDSREAWLEAADAGHDEGEYSVGEAVRVRFVGGVANAPAKSYFYAITQDGLRYATVGSSPIFRTTFSADSVPSFGITGVRFNGYGYDVAVSSMSPRLRLSDRRLTVQVTPDKARYAPGDTASVAIRTLGPDGAPVGASVYVQVVDEKLYAMGAADETDPLDALYAGGPGDGIIAWAVSHRTPGDDQGKGGGDTTGGGGGDEERADFRDFLVATLVTTGSDGTARVSVPLSDDLTSWHVSASAVDAAVEAGSGTGSLAVGLPFFAEATVAPQYLAVDRPIIRVRGFGSGLAAGEPVTFTVSSDTLPMSGTTVTAEAFKSADVSLPALSVGTHRIRITATVGSGSTRRTDTLVRTIDVVTTRTSRLMTTMAALDGSTAVEAGRGMTRITLVEAGRGRVVPVLQELASTDGGRADRVVAAGLANRVLVEQFGLEAPVVTGEADLRRFRTEDGVLAIVPYGSADLDVTALAGMAGDPRLDPDPLAGWLGEVMADKDQYTREQRLLALAGLAGLGAAVLAEVRDAAAQADLTVSEQISVAIAAFYAGDETLARSIERDVLAGHGLRLGPWVRIDPGSKADAAVQTARLAIVAASLGDPVAADMDAWVAANPPRTTTVDLERALAARGWARRVAGASAVAAVTVDGTRREVTIKPGEPASVVLTPAQAATARLEPVSGAVLAVTSRDGALDPASLAPAKGQKLVRTVNPSGAIGPTDTVIVTLKVTLGSEARDECWRVTDVVPSGLAPIDGGRLWEEDADGNQIGTGTSPDFVDGQRVEFCVTRDPKQPVQTVRYLARVVTPGTYLWEPAVLQSEVVPDQGVVVEPVTMTIKQ